MLFVFIPVIVLFCLLWCQRTRGVVGIVLLAAVLMVIAKRVALVRTQVPSITINAPRNVVRANAALLPSTLPTTQANNLWIEDWSQFVKTTHWRGFRAESSDTCATEGDAREEAIQDAARQLLSQTFADPSIARSVRSANGAEQMLKETLIRQLQSGQFISDQAMRTTEKPYGSLYKQYLLIDAFQGVGWAKQLARTTVAEQTAQQRATWGSLAALGLVIVMLYAFLNAATKGYFVWKLRAAAMMMAIIALLVVFAWAA